LVSGLLLRTSSRQTQAVNPEPLPIANPDPTDSGPRPALTASSFQGVFLLLLILGGLFLAVCGGGMIWLVITHRLTPVLKGTVAVMSRGTAYKSVLVALLGALFCAGGLFVAGYGLLAKRK